jgi:predicted RNA binding protein YcfA (HicA-like mRNA interferase family)
VKPVSGRAMCRALERAGWVLTHTRGSHHYYRRAGVGRPVCVPVHGNHVLRTGTQRAIMRQAGLTDADL